ncbi:MAG: PilZ domain-containing protein [Myxococcota bacterium]
MSTKPRVLRVEFAEEEEFRREYASNISKGGIFVPSRSQFEIRELVRVEIALAYCGKSLTFDGEVVHRVTQEMTETGGTPGISIHFQIKLNDLFERFQPYAGAAAKAGNERVAQTGRRRAPRMPARTPALLWTADNRMIEARSRNLSAVGALVSLYGDPVPVDQVVKLWLGDPSSGRELEVDARVIRQFENDAGDVSALALDYQLSEEQKIAVKRFVSDICAAEHSRRLGSISGPISEIGIENLPQMFGRTAPLGTLTLTRGHEEGFIAFEKGLLCAARLGSLSGVEAMVEMFSWREGKFDFQARVDWNNSGDSSPPIEAAVFEAMRLADERRRDEPPSFPPQAQLEVDAAMLEAERDGLDKAEQAISVLAEVGVTVAKMMDVIPERKAKIARVLGRMVERGLIRIRA